MTRIVPAEGITTFKCAGCGQRFPEAHLYYWEIGMTVCSPQCKHQVLVRLRAKQEARCEAAILAFVKQSV